jgi:hypothetical protein
MGFSMRNGARLLSEEVPLSADAGAEQFFSDKSGLSRPDLALSFLLGSLVAGCLLAVGTAITSLL